MIQTEREENRLRDLLETQAISQREYDNAVSENAIARAALQQAEVRVRDAELNLSYTNVAAPVSGISGRFRFSEGRAGGGQQQPADHNRTVIAHMGTLQSFR